MIKTEYPRPCPIPGHPQDEDEPVLVTESAWARLRAWHLRAPAERLPLPVIVLTWPAAWVLHAAHVAGHVVTYAAIAAAVACWLTWCRYGRESLYPRLLPIEAALAAAALGGWMAAADTWGPLGWPGHLLTWIYLAGAAGGYWWLRRHEAVRAARQRREDAAAWAARKAEWHRVAHLIGLGDFHLQKVTETLLGEELLLTSAPGSELATRVAASSRPYAEKYAHLRGLPYGRVDLRLTDYPGQLVIEIREKDPSVSGPVTHPALDPDSPFKDWFREHRSIRDPVTIGVIPETGEPMELVLWDGEGGKAIGIYSMTGGGKTNILDVVREAVTAMDDAVLVNLNGAGSGDERAWEPLSLLTAAGLQEDDPGVRRRSWARCAGCGTDRGAGRDRRRDRRFGLPADPGKPGCRRHRGRDRRDRQAGGREQDPGVPGVQAAQGSGHLDPRRAAGDRHLDRRQRGADQPVHGGHRHARP